MIKFVVGLPFSGRFVPPEFAMGLASMQVPMNTTFARVSIKGKPRAEARTQLIKTAQRLGAEYLLFLDDDTVPPSDVALKLIRELDSRPEYAACGGIYTDKVHHEPMVFMADGGSPFWRWRAGEIFPCWALGTGCLMVRLSVFTTLPEPWFRDIETKEQASNEPDLIAQGTELERSAFWMTDDIYFAGVLARAGHKMLAHGGVLPIHYDQEGAPHVLDEDAYPTYGIRDQSLWYRSIVPRTKVPEMIDDLPPGWLTPEEAKYLADQTRGKRVLELGCYKGRSTVAMAKEAAQVVSVDRHIGDQALGKCDTLPAFLRNIAEYTNITPIVADTRSVGAMFADNAFDVVFVDADHSLEGAKADLELAQRVGRVVLAHDWGQFDVTPAADAAGLHAVEVVGTVARLERAPQGE